MGPVLIHPMRGLSHWRLADEINFQQKVIYFNKSMKPGLIEQKIVFMRELLPLLQFPVLFLSPSGLMEEDDDAVGVMIFSVLP